MTGGIIFGALGFLFAPQVYPIAPSIHILILLALTYIFLRPLFLVLKALGVQISKALLTEDQKLKLPRFLEDEVKDPERTKQVGLLQEIGISRYCGMRV